MASPSTFGPLNRRQRQPRRCLANTSHPLPQAEVKALGGGVRSAGALSEAASKPR